MVIAEVGAWSNPLSPDRAIRRKALETCKTQLGLADRIGARCCVNISGSRGPKWDGPDPNNLTRKTFDLIVRTVREIIDSVNPTNTYYTLETMPWMYPNSPQSYLELVQAIDRDRFAVHLDTVNLVNSVEKYYGNAELTRECFRQLGPLIRSCHAKDILLSDQLTLHLSEVGPGTGNLDYRALLGELDGIDPDTPLMVEHLEGEREYQLAIAYIRSVAKDLGVVIV